MQVREQGPEAGVTCPEHLGTKLSPPQGSLLRPHGPARGRCSGVPAALGAGAGAGGWPWGRGRELRAGPRYLYWVVGDLAASNIFLRPSMPDMASTFFLQSPTSTGRSCVGHTRETERQPARRERDWAMGSQPALEGGAAPALLPPEQGGEPKAPSPQSPWGSGMFCQGAGLPQGLQSQSRALGASGGSPSLCPPSSQT